MRTRRSRSICLAALLAGVWRRHFDAGVAEFDDYRNATNAGQALLILAHLNCPNYPWVAASQLGPQYAEAIQRQLLSLRDFEIHLPFDPKLTRFARALDSEYDTLERDMEKAKQFDQPAGQER